MSIGQTLLKPTAFPTPHFFPAAANLFFESQKLQKKQKNVHRGHPLDLPRAFPFLSPCCRQPLGPSQGTGPDPWQPLPEGEGPEPTGPGLCHGAAETVWLATACSQVVREHCCCFCSKERHTRGSQPSYIPAFRGRREGGTVRLRGLLATGNSCRERSGRCTAWSSPPSESFAEGSTE